MPRRHLVDTPLPRGGLAVDLGLRRAGPQELGAVVADVGDRAEGDDPPGHRARAVR
jgi:hypothetical protein